MPTDVLKLFTIIDEYLEDMRLKQNVLDTQRKLTRWNEQFLDVMGDLDISDDLQSANSWMPNLKTVQTKA